MFTFKNFKSAAQISATKLLKNHCLILSSRFVSLSKTSNIRKMGWESEKQKYLSSHDDRNEEDWLNLQDILSWKQYAKNFNLSQAASNASISHGNNIDNSKNEILADKISIYAGDITTLKIDAIVNAANSKLMVGLGVDRAIHQKAGEYLEKECSTLGGCSTGEAKLTGGYKLPAKYVIQTVGPMGENPNALKNCYVNSLKLAAMNNIRSVAFPCISTGIYGYPNESAAHVALHAVRNFLEKHTDAFDRIIFCTFVDIDKDLYDRILPAYFPVKL